MILEHLRFDFMRRAVNYCEPSRNNGPLTLSLVRILDV